MKAADKSFRLCVFLLILVLVLVACSEAANTNTESASSSEQEVVVDSQVAFIYPENAEEYNWSHLHEIGRQYLDEKLPDVGTKYVDEVSAEGAEEVLRQLANEGHKLIFATAPEYSDAVLRVAKDFPRYQI